MTQLRLTPLGGVGRFGRNCLCVEVEGGPAILVDCGVRFVADEYPGFDVGLPDLERIAALGDRLLGVVVTHGHEDHIGGLPYVVGESGLPIWATAFTARLILRRFQRLGLAAPAIDVVDVVGADGADAAAASRQVGPFRVTWHAVSHSIPDAACVVIETPAGTLVHSGDFRVDDNPVLGPLTDLEGLARAGDRGVAVLLADSTGALLPGRNPGERSVGAALTASVQSARGRVFIALFASHVQRLSLVGEACRASKRKLCLLGTGLKETVKAARDLALLQIDDVLVDESGARNYPKERMVYAVTGSQGEHGSALWRLATGEHPDVDVDRGDRVIVSARVIPGNERRVLDLVEALAERGADIVDGRASPHVSGHGYAGDLELLLAAVRPQAFVALHGNARNLLAHAHLAKNAGLDAARVVDLRDGSTLVLDGTAKLTHLPGVRALEPLAQNGAVEMFPRDAIDVRKRMSTGGVLVIARAEGSDAGTAPSTPPVRLVFRGVSPALPDGVVRALEADAVHALSVAGTPEEPAAIKVLARHFWRARRVPPEIVLVPTAPLGSL